jgi:REP element-mobilizing transposase RayT
MTLKMIRGINLAGFLKPARFERVAMQKTISLQPGEVYHLYIRGNNREDLFRKLRNYRYFLELYTRHVHPVTDTFAYCLTRNHFHLLVRIRETSRVTQTSRVIRETHEVLTPQAVSQAFSNLFNAYAKSFNKTYGRTGYFMSLVTYIHQNPQRHGFVDDFLTWEWSSYAAFQSNKPTKIDRDEVLAWFGSVRGFDEAHDRPADERALKPLIDDDLD